MTDDMPDSSTGDYMDTFEPDPGVDDGFGDNDNDDTAAAAAGTDGSDGDGGTGDVVDVLVVERADNDGGGGEPIVVMTISISEAELEAAYLGADPDPVDQPTATTTQAGDPRTDAPSTRSAMPPSAADSAFRDRSIASVEASGMAANEAMLNS